MWIGRVNVLFEIEKKIRRQTPKLHSVAVPENKVCVECDTICSFQDIDKCVDEGMIYSHFLGMCT